MNIFHLPSGLEITVNRDNIFSVGHPALGRSHQFSAPSCSSVLITSPPWRIGSNLAKRSSRLTGLSSHGVITIA